LIGMSKKPTFFDKKTGFTLVELLISVAVLGCGLVIIIQSYISALRGIEFSHNYFDAVKIVGKKFAEMEFSSYEKKGLLAGYESAPEEVKIGSRQGNLYSEVKDTADPDYLANDTVELCVKLNWQERANEKNIGMAMYLPKRNEDN
jgi:prepilin-type N-terminal cleavage/methylation domain-containing protein